MTTPHDQSQFMDVMSAIPRWLRVCFLVAIGASMSFGVFMSQTGLNVYFNRYLEAHVKRFEQSVERLESATTDMESLLKRMEAYERSAKELNNAQSILDRRLGAVETHVDDHARRIRDLEVKSRGGKQ